jgi:D-serine dehydratase
MEAKMITNDRFINEGISEINNEMIKKMQNEEEVFWLNEKCDNVLSPDITEGDIKDAEKRLLRFAPYIQRVYPETALQNGIIETPLVEIAAMKEYLAGEAGQGRLLLKCDNSLPISGSIKARGGIYEVLWLAEKIALEKGMLNEGDDYSILAGSEFRKLFSEYSVAVGSTGNLGLSIGIMSAQLGFSVSVHMSSDAKQWKKDMLRQKGAEVVEYPGDYQKAVAAGRKLAESDPRCHFVDDENSKTLFLGYAVAAGRLQKQLLELGIKVDQKHPLFVYLPCGVGGAPGGVTYGLKQIFGENVHCFFAEPIQAPCMLLGVMTGLHDKIEVADIGLSGKTAADGLAVGRPSKLVSSVCGNLLDGLFTVFDEKMSQLMIALYEKENIFVEPSAAAGFPGYELIQQNKEYVAKFDSDSINNATHIVWATGGGMVPQDEKIFFLTKKS